MYRAVNLFILQNDTIQHRCFISADSQLADGGIALIGQQYIQLLTLIPGDLLKLSILHHHAQG